MSNIPFAVSNWHSKVLNVIIPVNWLTVSDELSLPPWATEVITYVVRPVKQTGSNSYFVTNGKLHDTSAKKSFTSCHTSWKYFCLV